MARTIAERSDVVPRLAEVFRSYGYEGASLARITEGTGLGKGSIYHFFPGGKDEMAQAVLDDIDAWFRERVFLPLRQSAAPDGVAAMLHAVGQYFMSGQRVCLVGVFALGHERDRFAQRVRGYFDEWIVALAGALERGGRDPAHARDLAEEAVGAIQGALVLARAAEQPALFTRTLERVGRRLA
ncbi:TetR family transcriptional regulator [Janthinobacterium sp. BJB412]|nr:TetR family transcriptional regulator [Janthinobacterium sp. BJB412]